MPERRFRVLMIASHPVQYHGQLFRRTATCPNLDLHVAYCSLRGAETGHDPEFGANIQWDVPLLDGYHWTHVPNMGPGDESFLGIFNPGLWNLIRDGKFDAVISFVGYVRATFWIAYLAARASGAAFLFGCDQGSLDSRDGRRWKSQAKRLAWPLLYRLADHVLVSSTRARQLIRSLGIPEERISLTLLVVDNDWWMARAADVDRAAVRSSWGASEKDVVFLYCAKLQPWKRPLDLLRAFARVGQTNSLLVFAGEGPQRPELEAEAAALGVASRVRFLGFLNQSQLPAVYKSADLMILPSAYEPFAVVVNEAMCCGCPVAVSDQVGAGPDLVAPVNPGFIFPAGDVEALATLMSGVLSDPAQLREWSRRSLARMHDWSPERGIAATVDAIRAAVFRRGRRTPDSSPVSTVKSSIPGSN
jgi:glycosyltransferase involved in cell wall biosynthesis